MGPLVFVLTSFQWLSSQIFEIFNLKNDVRQMSLFFLYSVCEEEMDRRRKERLRHHGEEVNYQWQTTKEGGC